MVIHGAAVFAVRPGKAPQIADVPQRGALAGRFRERHGVGEGVGIAAIDARGICQRGRPVAQQAFAHGDGMA